MKKILLALAVSICLSIVASAQTIAHSVVLSWTKSTDPCVTSTNIHKAITSGGEIPVGQSGSNFATVPTGTQTYTDNTVLAGQTNYWTISAWGSTCGGTLHESVMSSEIKTVVPTDPPPAPTGLTAIVQ